ncbi:hypothetical protein PC116_g33929 [Phytophthora cactorum]|nr:hypothetical protein PC116_g33929 [Phytophthora cactorum]
MRGTCKKRSADPALGFFVSLLKSLGSSDDDGGRNASSG